MRPHATLADLIADRLIGIARDLCSAIDRAAQVAEKPAHPRRYFVAWADSFPMIAGTSRILEWWPDHPEIRARILALHKGDGWIDDERNPDGVPVCAVIRLE